ncbi:type II secretion system secretin GspD [Reinekea marinisedimentorum]|uniref:General secretion pathway protein D n=1 Tax=Reinekea marinisedimentorum TaxID=230495 RepID=A0A4R3IC34_9GAMM|nr:type II secretion system secretin GspD [Reinekea marinisedimentorum]TCS42078.1 general secretion pathway protein D [Reinekea marinisedimentorum]
MVVIHKLKLVFAASVVFASAMIFAADGEKYTLNMQNADIKEVIDLVAKVTGKTFIVDPRVRGNVTVVSDKEMTEPQIYETFLATLEVYGFSAVEAGDVTKIISQSDIKSSGISVDLDGERVGEEIVTRVFTIENVTATELVPILRPLVAKYGHLAGVASANVLVVADRATNMERLADIIRLLDRADTQEIEVVSLQHSYVSSMITLLESIAPGNLSTGKESSSSAQGVHLVGDERSNRIIVKGEKAERQQIIDLITKLDTPVNKEQDSSYKVIFLNYADATQMSEILKGISTPASTSSKSENGSPQDSQGVTILADENQNALVIKASPSELSQIENLISQLDIARNQVLIEAAIVEISSSGDESFGVQWLTNPESTYEDGLPFFSSSSDVAGNSISTIASAIDDADSAWGAVTGVSTGTTFAISDPTLSIMAIIEALESQTNSNLLSTPSVLTLDNTEAFITVGNEVPFITGGSGTDDDPYTIDREDVGTTLTVVPHVQKDGTIRLEVDQSVESVTNDVVDGAVDIVTSKKEIKTEILVKSGQVVILGGLISDEVQEIETRVPLLSSIPILGNLFKSTSSETSKSNLLVIMRPSIVTDDMSEYRKKRLNGIWELRLESFESDEYRLDQPGIDSLYDGTFLNGTPVPLQ